MHLLPQRFFDARRIFFLLLFLSSGLSSAPSFEDGGGGGGFDVDRDTTSWAIKLSPGTSASGFASEHGVTLVKSSIGILENHIVVSHRHPSAGEEGRSARQVHRAFDEDDRVVWASVERLRLHSKRTALDFADPLYPNQWHLNGAGGAAIDLNVIPAWERGFTGSGVGICVADDGLDHDHPDFRDGLDRYNASASYDWVADKDDPSPKDAYDQHGTECAGTSFAGANNGVCGVGVAFGASFSGARLISRPVPDSTEAQALTKDLDTNHIFSCSWGPNDDAKNLVGPGPVTLDALAHAVAIGRRGLGTIYVWAGGNGRASRDNVNYDGYANSVYTISVAAVSSSGRVSSYSEPGAPLLVSCPSSPRGIVSTAVHGACTSSFGGTSAAAPQVAGVVALMLEANDQLHWRDVQEVLLRTARAVDNTDRDWMSNGAGFRVNHNYGFGLIDASAAVTTAQTWTSLPPAREPLRIASPRGRADPIPRNTSTAVEQSIKCDQSFYTEHVQVYVRIAHSNIGQLDITLTSPQGTPSHLFAPHNRNSHANIDWTFSSVRMWGEDPKGHWTLTVRDTKQDKNRGSLLGWELIIHGSDR